MMHCTFQMARGAMEAAPNKERASSPSLHVDENGRFVVVGLVES